MDAAALWRRCVLPCLPMCLASCLATCLVPSCAQASRLEGVSQYVPFSLTNKNGLPQNSINAVAQSRDGYLWFGTEEGLVRFDCLRATVFDTIHFKALGDNFIDAIAASRDGGLWIGTRSGVVRFKDSAFQPYLNANAPIGSVLI
jgi:ligand-binding sensor domain-containing protein